MSEESALLEIAKAINNLARATERLGMNDAVGPMGAIEGFGDHIGKKLDRLADALECLTE